MSDDDHPRERHLRVERTARYYTLGAGGGGDARPARGGMQASEASDASEPVPSDASEPVPSEIWFACHGYRQLAGRFLRRFAPLDDGTRLIVAPEALSRFYLDDDVGPHGPDARIGATWMTRADRENEIRDYVDYLDALYDHILDERDLDRDAVRVVTLGFSQGTATASRWAVLGRARIDRLVLWAGTLAHDLEPDAAADRLRDVDLTFVAGSRDRFTPPERAEREIARLEREHGIEAGLVSFEDGHRLNEDALLELAGG